MEKWEGGREGGQEEGKRLVSYRRKKKNKLCRQMY